MKTGIKGAFLLTCVLVVGAASPSPIQPPIMQPQAQAPQKETDAPSWWSEIVDKLSDALATLIAAGVGFGASMMAERVAWRRRKAEEIRSEQLTKLLQSARNIEMCRTKLARFQNLATSVANPGPGQDVDVLRATTIRSAQETAMFLGEKLGEIELEKLELRALRVGSTALDAIGSSALAIANSVSTLEQLGRRFDQTSALQLSADDIPIDTLTEAVLVSLEQG